MKTLFVTLVLVASSFVAPAAVGAAPDESSDGRPPTFFVETETSDRWTLRPTVDLLVYNGMPHIAETENLYFDVQTSRADMRANRPGPWVDARTNARTQSFRLRIRSGEVMCVRVREIRDGRTSAWAQRYCVVRALDDRELRSRGRVATVRDRRYLDRHAAKLGEGARLVLPRVPKGARYGFVVTRLRDPRYCGVGEIHLASARHGDAQWGTSAPHLVQYWFRTARHGGAAVYVAGSSGACRVGGAVVLPRWVLRR